MTNIEKMIKNQACYSIEKVNLLNFTPDELEDEEKTEYCFIRLYKTEYKKNEFSFGKALRVGNALISEKLPDGILYTHAAMHYKLTDDFIGLNLDPNDPNDVKVEVLHNSDGLITNKGKDVANSGYVIYALPLSKKEYLNLGLVLNKIRNQNKFKYDVKTLLWTAMLITRRKAIRFFSREDQNQTDDISQTLSQMKIGLVCSTFVAFILKSISPDIATHFDKKGISFYEFSPNSLVNLPGIEKLFEGTWLSYEKDVKKFVNQNPKFKKYSLK